MTRKTKLLLLICLPLLGILAGYILMARQVTLSVDGETQEITTRAFTVGGALRSAGYEVGPLDLVSPPASSWLSGTTSIVLEHARSVRVWNDGNSELVEVNTPALIPSEILRSIGITLAAEDVVRVNGLVVPPNEAITLSGSITLQYTPAVMLTLNRDDETLSFNTTTAYLGQALWEQGIRLHGGDAFNQSVMDAVNPELLLTINSAVPLIITVDYRDLPTFVWASTVGEALAMAGVSLQDLDYSKPAETEPLPEDGRIVVVRVREDILVEQQSIPFGNETVSDVNLSIGQSRVVTPGEPGLQTARVRVRYEDGVEVSRVALETVVIKSPVNEVLAYGTTVELKTESIASCGTITYWKALSGVTATSYSPCNLGVDRCNSITASGAEVKKGILAVHLDWYRILKGTKICVPGYGIGTVADIGAYPYNHNWVDLGYTDEEFAQAAQLTFHNLTIYFLLPMPASGEVVLP